MTKTRNQKQARTNSASQDRGSDELNEQKQPASELAAMLDAALSHDEMPQALFNVIVDFFQEKIEATGLEATIPEIAERPVMEMVLGAERRRELFVEQQEKARLKSPAAVEGDGKGRNSPAELAGHLSAVLTHPATPAELYNAIANEVSTWSSAYCSAVSETVPYIESCLLYHQREQQERTEGGHADDEQR